MTSGRKIRIRTTGERRRRRRRHLWGSPSDAGTRCYGDAAAAATHSHVVDRRRYLFNNPKHESPRTTPYKRERHNLARFNDKVISETCN